MTIKGEDKNNNNNNTSDIDDLDLIPNRGTILDTLQTAIDKLSIKAFNGRVKNPKTENVKISYYKALIYAISTYNAILKDTEIDELKKEIEEMKGMLKNDG